MSGKYASNTEVPVSRSIAEIQTTLERYGADELIEHVKATGVLPQGGLPAITGGGR